MREVTTMWLDGVERTLRPSWEAYADIEARTGFSIRALWIRLAKGEATLKEMATVVAAGMKAESPDKAVSDTKIMMMLFAEGPWDEATVQPISEYLEKLGWTPEQRKKILAAVKAMETETITSASSSHSAPPDMG